mgnify:CR=1 FL=1
MDRARDRRGDQAGRPRGVPPSWRRSLSYRSIRKRSSNSTSTTAISPSASGVPAYYRVVTVSARARIHRCARDRWCIVLSLEPRFDRAGSADAYPWIKSIHIISMVALDGGLRSTCRVFTYITRWRRWLGPIGDFQSYGAALLSADYEPGDGRDLVLRTGAGRERRNRRSGEWAGSGRSSLWSRVDGLPWSACPLAENAFAADHNIAFDTIFSGRSTSCRLWR